MIAVLPSRSSAMSASFAFGTSMGALTTWSDHPSDSRHPTEKGVGASAPEVAPPVVVDDFDATLPEHVQPGRIAIRLSVIDARDVGVDDHLGAHHARRGADEHHLARQLSAGLDQTVLLRMKTAAISRLIGVTSIGQTLRVAVVADAEHLGQVAGGDDTANLQAGAGRPLGQLLGHAHVHLFERDAVRDLLGLRGWIWGRHLAQVNRLVYTHFPGYNAPHVAIRTVVRAAPGMCAGRNLGRGAAGLEPHPTRRRAVRCGGRAAPAHGDW